MYNTDINEFLASRDRTRCICSLQWFVVEMVKMMIANNCQKRSEMFVKQGFVSHYFENSVNCIYVYSVYLNTVDSFKCFKEGDILFVLDGNLWLHTFKYVNLVFDVWISKTAACLGFFIYFLHGIIYKRLFFIVSLMYFTCWVLKNFVPYSFRKKKKYNFFS